MMGFQMGIDRLLRSLFSVAPWAQMKAEPPTSWWEKLMPFKWQKRPQPQFSPLPAQPVAATEPAPVAPEPAAVQPAQVDYSVDWRKYFNDVYSQLQRRPLPPPPELPMPAQPAETDWQKLLPLALGMMLAPSSVRDGMLQALAQRYVSEQQAQQDYIRALAERAYRQAELERQHQILQEQQDAQTRDEALKLAMSMAADEERRALQAQLETLRNQRALEVARMQNDMQAVSRHMAIVNNPNLPAEQRAAAYQNAAAILAQYGYELPALPSMPSVAERQQVLREQIEPQRLQLAERKQQFREESWKQEFDLKRWQAQQQVQQKWQQLRNQERQVGISAGRLQLAIRNQNWKEARAAQGDVVKLYQQLDKQEQDLMRELNRSGQFGNQFDVIPTARMQQLLAGAPPQDAVEARFQDIGTRLMKVREMKGKLETMFTAPIPAPQPASRPTPAPQLGTQGGVFSLQDLLTGRQQQPPTIRVRVR